MSDYIEREAVLAYPLRKDKCDREHANKHFIFGIESVIEFVEDLPAADVAPVRHGRWIPSDYTGDCCYTCSECGFERDAYLLDVGDYCPACGAKMDKVGGDDPGPPGVPGPPGEVVFCKDCDHLEFSDCYGECGRGYLGIVKPYDYCSRGMRRDKEADT